MLDINIQSPKSPKIMLVSGTLQAGGAERVMSDMANYWENKGWRVTLATWTGPEILDFYKLNSGVERIWLNVNTPNKTIIDKMKANILRVFKLRRILSDSQPDAVLSFIDIPNMLTIMATMGLKVRVVVSERIHPAYYFGIAWPWRLLRKVVYRWADAVVAQTYDAADWIESNCNVKSVVIPNPLRLLPEVNIKREKIIVAVGRLSKQKGFDLLLRSFKKISNDYNDWRVVIIGQGIEYDNLLQLRDELSLTERVDFVGQVQNVENWMARAGLVVQPSRFEGFPNVILEAMGMGAAVISANCPSGPAELIQEGINGRLVRVDDVNDLAIVMEHLLGHPDIRDKFGKDAVKVRDIFRQDKVMKKWQECLQC